MLVLSRKVGERIKIGDDIELYVTKITSREVRIGIEAPKDTPIYRREVYDALTEANIASSQDSEVNKTNIISLIEYVKKNKKK